ncbi:hypothetical protein GCM10027271_46780 [Saccharopolyspora gloriosae]|uniref:Mg-chelatase subunit ChlI n=1 Tax=Saccharopolyspora gloriosae TaxID=455344 RepID=A0A840NR74_9PSEU|nr:hypothetical protein [Saccharopolyspora gloriosae]MBB5071759.1 Mg-chelatase subunit ChlI [Saccharopolyspora gloriosae]
MDPRDRADETLARARARGTFVVTPDNASSPMDASTTVRIPRTVVAAADQAPADTDSTMAIPQSARQQQRPEQRQQSQTGQQQAQAGQPQSQSQTGQQQAQSGQAQQQTGQQYSGQQQPAPQQAGQYGGRQQGQQPSSQQQHNDGYSWPAEDYGQLPPNPYQAQRGEGQFGPLGSRAARQNQQY